MLTITKEQMAVFREPAIEAFVKKVLVHLNKCFPDRCKEMGEPKLHELVRCGIQRAASYRISSQRDVCKYVDLMMVFGQDFDQDPNVPWASEILNSKAIINPTTKVERLCKAVQKQTKQKKTQGASRG